MDVIWTATAEEDLNAIIDYISERNPIAALRLGREIENSASFLSDHPRLYRMSSRLPNCREIVVHGNYIVLYQELSDMVLILNVVHARRDFPTID